LKLINGIVGAALLITLLENRDPYLAVAGLALALLWGLSLRLSRGPGFRRVEQAIVICLAYWIASYFWSVRDFHNFISPDFYRRDGATLVSYTVFLGLLSWSLRPRQCRRYWILFLTVLGLIAVPTVAYCLHLIPFDLFGRLGLAVFDPSVGGRMFMGWFEGHNTAGGVCALAGVLTLALVYEAKLTPKMRHFLWALFGVCLAALVFTYSRGSYLGFLVGAAYVIPLRKAGRTLQAALLIGIPVVLLGLMTSTVFNRMDTIVDPEYGTNADRFRIWGEALDDIESSPIIGIGYSRFNDFPVEFKGVKGLVWVETTGIIVNDDSHAHNSYLHFWAEGGIIGLWLTLRIWRCAWTELSFFESKLQKSELYRLIRGSKACLLATLMLSFTEHILGKGSVVLVLMSLIGMTLAAARLEWRAAQKAAEARLARGLTEGRAKRMEPVAALSH
jgi:O-antigen ligase